MHSSNLSYETIDTFLFNEIPWFKEFFFKREYDTEDLQWKHIVMWVLCDFVQSKYLNKDITITGNRMELDTILDTLNYIYIYMGMINYKI